MMKNSKNTGQRGSFANKLAEARATKSNVIDILSISLFRRSRAIMGIEEQFQVNPGNGTSFSISLTLSPNRSRFAPALSVRCHSGAGNCPVGLGRSLDFLSLQQKTDKHLPCYPDGGEYKDNTTDTGLQSMPA